MLQPLIDSLTREHRQLLHEFGVKHDLLSRWRTGKRLPTEPQAMYLAAITGIDAGALMLYLAQERATKAQRDLIARAMGKLKHGAGVMLSFGAGAPL